MASILDNLLTKIERGAAKGIEKGALRIEADAKELTPVDTGNLRASLTTKADGLKAEVGTNVNYAAYVELGTSSQQAQPYLYPAYAKNKKQILKDVADAISREV